MESSNRRIAKNSLYMYIQMAIKIVVSLYTTRVILHALGSEDFGINNVVGGVVTMFVFISGTMSSASQRFFASEIGLGNRLKLNRYFNVTVCCYIIIILSLIFIIEAVGYWFVNFKFTIPDNRMYAANVILQFSIIAFVMRMISVPYGAMIIAYEKMFIFAFIGLTDSVLTLAAALFLQSYEGDRLIAYSFFLLSVSVVNTLFCYFFCRFSFRDDVKIRLFWDKAMFVEIVSYSGWSLFWTMANVARSQGLNILLNIFFNPVVNAARGIAYQVNNVINQFTNSFYQAVRPQITKLTVREERDRMMYLMFSSSRISFFLLATVAVPLLIKTPYILTLWLGEVPEYTAIFMRLVIVVAMIDSLGHPPTTSICATGRIKWFHLCVGGILIMNIPISYILLKNGSEPVVVFQVSVVMSVLAQFARLVFMHYMHDMSIREYVRRVLNRILIVLALSLVCSYYLSALLNDSFFLFCLFVFLSCSVTMLLSYFIGITVRERDKINMVAKRTISKAIKRRL